MISNYAIIKDKLYFMFNNSTIYEYDMQNDSLERHDLNFVQVDARFLIKCGKYLCVFFADRSSATFVPIPVYFFVALNPDMTVAVKAHLKIPDSIATLLKSKMQTNKFSYPIDYTRQFPASVVFTDDLRKIEYRSYVAVIESSRLVKGRHAVHLLATYKLSNGQTATIHVKYKVRDLLNAIVNKKTEVGPSDVKVRKHGITRTAIYEMLTDDRAIDEIRKVGCRVKTASSSSYVEDMYMINDDMMLVDIRYCNISHDLIFLYNIENGRSRLMFSGFNTALMDNTDIIYLTTHKLNRDATEIRRVDLYAGKPNKHMQLNLLRKVAVKIPIMYDWYDEVMSLLCNDSICTVVYRFIESTANMYRIQL